MVSVAFYQVTLDKPDRPAGVSDSVPLIAVRFCVIAVLFSPSTQGKPDFSSDGCDL